MSESLTTSCTFDMTEFDEIQRVMSLLECGDDYEAGKWACIYGMKHMTNDSAEFTRGYGEQYAKEQGYTDENE